MIRSGRPSCVCKSSAACISRLTSVCVRYATPERIPARASFPLSLTEKPSAAKLKFRIKHAVRIRQTNFFIFILKFGKYLAFLCVKLDKKRISGYPNKNKEVLLKWVYRYLPIY